ncbi:MAG: hypothetical protein IT162_16105 [Bryobacterales bacterium]|nr:hypothetical protein [Bryobacterales bacterium]
MTWKQSALKPREYASSWDRGMAEGLQQGLDTLRAVLVDVLSTRFGEVPASVRIDELRALTHRALTAATLGDLGLSSPPASTPRRSAGTRP